MPFGGGAVCPPRWVPGMFLRLRVRHQWLVLCVRGGRGQMLLFMVEIGDENM